MILCEKRGNHEIHEFPAKVSSGIPKKEQLFICFFAPQTEVPLPRAKSAENMEFHKTYENHEFYAKVLISRKNHPEAAIRARG